MAGTVINPETKVGEGCIINPCSSIDHDCKIGDFVHVAVGAHVCGTVKIGKHTWIDAGSAVSNNLNICEDVMVGAGAVVVKDIPGRCTVVGSPAKPINVDE